MGKHDPSHASWPNPLELQDLRDAVKFHAPQVILTGRLFHIRYEDDMFYLSPSDGYTPCGWFDPRTAFAEIE